MTDKITDRLAYRDELVGQAQFLVRVIDSPSTDPVLREEAEIRFADIDLWLCTADGPARQVSVIYVYRGYREMVEEILTEEFTPEQLAEQELRVMWVRYAAELADGVPGGCAGGYSDDFRLEAVDTLNQLLGSLRRCAELELVE